MNVMPKDFLAEVEFCWTFRNALKILYTIKPVARAFTAMEKATPMLAAIRLSEVRSRPGPGHFFWTWTCPPRSSPQYSWT